MLSDEQIMSICDSFCEGSSETEYIRAIIAANNAEVLKDLKPSLMNAWDDVNKRLEDVAYSTEQVAALAQERDALLAKYGDLVQGVTKKFVGESLHETAKRYICNWEGRSPESKQAKSTS